MASDAEAEDAGFPEDEVVEPGPYFVEVWNDYDPSMRFAVIFPVGEDDGRRLELRRLLHHRAGQAHRASTPTTPRRSCSSPRARARSSRSDRRSRSRPASSSSSRRDRPRHLRAGQRGAPAALVLPDAGGDQHVPAGDLPDRRQRAELEAAERAGHHRARPEQPSRGLPVRPLDELGLAEGGGPKEPRELTMTERLIGMNEPGRPAAVDRPGERASTREGSRTRRRRERRARGASSDASERSRECGRGGIATTGT